MSISDSPTHRHELYKEEESTFLNDTAAGITRSFSRVLAAYPRFKFFRPKMQTKRFENSQAFMPAGVQAASQNTALPAAVTLPMSRSLSFAINLISGVALFRVYDSTKPAEAGVLSCAKSGAMGGMVHGLIMHPFEIMLMRGVCQWHQVPITLKECLQARVILSSPLTVVRDGVGFGLFFGVYEGVRQASGETGVLATAVAGTAGAAAHHVVAYPLQSVRNFLGPQGIQSSPQQILQAVRSDLKQPSVLYHGFFRSMLRSLPGGALTFVVYEAVLSPWETKQALKAAYQGSFLK